MSAFFVSRQTIHDAVTAYCHAAPQTRSLEQLTQLGRAFWSMNASAMVQRYPSIHGTGEHRDYLGASAAYVYRAPKHLSLAQMAMSLNCLIYQCSEGDVPQQPRYKLLTAASDALGQPRGYDDATWDREHDTPATRKEATQLWFG
jgi:hypothetical protein